MTAVITETNWAGNLEYSAARRRHPRSVGEVQEMVSSASRVKALGTRHCFNDIADFAGGDQIALDEMPSVVDIDTAASTVTVSAATRYGDMAQQLHRAGFGLENLASLPHISVIGTISTATHGSGETHQSLASAASAIEFVLASGELRRFSRADDPDVFPGVVVGLGALGVATSVTLDLVPTYQIRQDVFENMTWDNAFEHFDEIEAAAYSVSFFTNWSDPTVNQLWLKSKVLPGEAFTAREEMFGARAATRKRHPADPMGASPDVCTDQLGVPGPWYERDCHFKLEFTPSSGAEIQTEYLIPRRHAIAAFEVFRSLGDRITPLLIVSEIRTIAADDLWMSPMRGEDCAAVHLTWQRRQEEVEALVEVIEERLRPFAARPHWGKVFHGGPELESLYPKMDDFRNLATALDPNGAFRNPYLNRNIFHD